MSDQNIARRAAVQVNFAGVDITNDIRKYLLSLTYTDSEEDEADDLQIKLQDRLLVVNIRSSISAVCSAQTSTT